MTYLRSLEAQDGNGGWYAVGERCRVLRYDRLIALVLLLVMSPVSAEIFKWTDAGGQIHYGERPPFDHETQEMPSVAPPPEADVRHAEDRLSRWLERQQRNEQLRREDEEKAEQETTEMARDDAAREAYCQRQRRNLRKLETARPVYRVDGQGERVYLDDEARARNIEKLSSEIRKNCR